MHLEDIKTADDLVARLDARCRRAIATLLGLSDLVEDRNTRFSLEDRLNDFDALLNRRRIDAREGLAAVDDTVMFLRGLLHREALCKDTATQIYGQIKFLEELLIALAHASAELEIYPERVLH